jgi:hypothetical protein
MFHWTPVNVVFTLGAFASWGYALRWAISQSKDRWYHMWVLGLVTLFWWLGESIAIRLGKYQYPNLPFRVHLPGGGTPAQPGPFENWLRQLLPAGERLPSELSPACSAASWDIPFPVVAIEAALLFGIFRLGVRLLRCEKGGRLRGALATAGLSALLMVNVTAVLDPVVSVTRWCDAERGPGGQFLNVGLWEWYTTPTHPGFWYGVPLVNYAAWFLAASSFAFVMRLDDQRPSGIVKRYKAFIMYLVATIAITLIILALLIFVKVRVDRIFAYGRAYMFSSEAILTQKHWEFAVMIALLALAVAAVAIGRRHHNPRFDSISSVPIVMIFIFCLALLAIEPHAGIFGVWLTTAFIATAVLLWPRIAQRIASATSPGKSEPDRAD